MNATPLNMTRRQRSNSRKRGRRAVLRAVYFATHTHDFIPENLRTSTCKFGCAPGCPHPHDYCEVCWGHERDDQHEIFQAQLV